MNDNFFDVHLFGVHYYPQRWNLNRQGCQTFILEPGLEGTPIGMEEKEERRGRSLVGPGEGSKHLTAVW